MKFKNIFFLLTTIFICYSCDDMKDFENPAELPDTKNEWGRMFVLCEGLFNHNNSTLACFDYDAHTRYFDFFKEVGKNKRGLGDTANDMQLYNGLLWVVLNISSQIEVIDPITGKSIKQIPLFSESGAKKTARQPRNIAFYKDKAYVCSFDGTLVRIDTHTHQVEATVNCGRNPDGLTIANEKIYVSNSGGLDAKNGLSYDKTVSVIDIHTFQEIKKIEVSINPHKIATDSEGDVYVVSRGNHGSIKAKFQRINSKTDELVQSFNELATSNFVIHSDTAYMYNYDITTDTHWVKTFDCLKEELITEQFITDGTELIRPFSIYVHPVNGNVYISDVRDYVNRGDVFCFDKKGKLLYQVEEVGINPNNFLFFNF